MSTYETIHLLVSVSMLTVSLISLIIALIKAVSKGKK
ncbi:MAG: putative holin-like toxin [Tepidanaerobacteraceae bacterium]|nr:putative holin-like toxin [Tepidanaerobacteraceae bacterium]